MLVMRETTPPIAPYAGYQPSPHSRYLMSLRLARLAVGRARLEATHREADVVLGVPARDDQARPMVRLANVADRRGRVEVRVVRLLAGRAVERQVEPLMACARERTT
jgi:hypothetical protein